MAYTLHRRCGRARSLSELIRDVSFDHVGMNPLTGATVMEALRVLSLALPQSWLTQTTDGVEKLWRLNPGLALTTRTEEA